MPNLRPDQVQKIHDYIHNQQIIHAIKLYREATGASLVEAKSAVEEMARDEFSKPQSGVRDYDNPILESRLKSLLVKGRKIDAVKIFREEYGVGLKEAKDHVDQIEASMRRENPSMGVPYESAISADPFADDEGNRRRVIVMAVGILVLLCGAGAFFALISF
jgi:ribosomal protein L7/L12